MTISSDEQLIRDLVALWHNATAAGDVDGVLKLMADDVIFLVAGHPPMVGKATFAKGLRGLLATHFIESVFDIHEVVVSGSLAYCWTDLAVRIQSRNGGPVVARSGSAVSILQRQPEGQWVVTRDANLLAIVEP